LSKFYTELDEKLQEIMAEKKIFFVGTADTDGRVNLSPKGMGSLKIIKSIDMAQPYWHF
jgi:predicted pyridoxine 5'-phosphate oxidase superfamily flavin-nucleotide-binding protein